MIASLRLPLLALLVIAGLAGPARAADVTVFAAASMKTALDAVDAAFTAATGKSVAASYAASSTLARQIEAGAPADVFISADLDWMDDLASHAMVEASTRANLLGNALVLVAPADSALAISLGPTSDLAGALGQGRLAIPDPASVPAGKYGKAALEHYGLWASVAGRLAQAQDVRAALAFVARGEAPLGVVYATDAVAEPKVRVVATFPEDSHAPIVYPGAIVVGAKGAATRDYFAFLRSPAAAPLFAAQGFTVLR